MNEQDTWTELLGAFYNPETNTALGESAGSDTAGIELKMIARLSQMGRSDAAARLWQRVSTTGIEMKLPSSAATAGTSSAKIPVKRKHETDTTATTPHDRVRKVPRQHSSHVP